MKRLVAAFGVLMAVGAAPLHAEDSQWCVELDVFTKNCAFATYDECTTIASNGGGKCVHNPKYQPPATSAQPKAKPARGAAKPH